MPFTASRRSFQLYLKIVVLHLLVILELLQEPRKTQVSQQKTLTMLTISSKCDTGTILTFRKLDKELRGLEGIIQNSEFPSSCFVVYVPSARSPNRFFYEIMLSMKWTVVSKGDGRCRGDKFRWTLNRYESLKNACRNASHEWTRRLNRAWRIKG